MDDVRLHKKAPADATRRGNGSTLRVETKRGLKVYTRGDGKIKAGASFCELCFCLRGSDGLIPYGEGDGTNPFGAFLLECFCECHCCGHTARIGREAVA